MIKLQNTPAKARNHTTTVISTWTTNAVWKKSIQGIISLKKGVLDSTIRMVNKPPITKEAKANKSHPMVKWRAFSWGTCRVKA
ncbi:hypothetical protein BGP_6125 [Beggiatoa sp. PS]|nr:hypothetical protein BGP_6125 [Beggiatoa sp. PS]